MTAFLIPLTSSPQTFSIQLAGTFYNFRLIWNQIAQAWQIDISDINNNLLIGSLPLVTGLDLLEQYAYIGIGGQLIVQTDYDTDAIPTLSNLGTNSNLYFVTP